MKFRLCILLMSLIPINRLAAQSGSETATIHDPIQNANVSLVNPNGTPFLLNKNSSITNGSVFYKDDFLPATIYFSDQKAAKTSLRLDLLENKIHYLDNKVEMILEQEVQKIILQGPEEIEIFVPGTSLPTQNEKLKKSWFKVIRQNDLTVYLLYNKTILDYKPINSGVTEKTIDTRVKYFIVKDGELVSSKKNSNKN